MKSRKSSAVARANVVRAPSDVLEVLDRVLDRGIVIDAWLRVSVVGLTLVDVDARVVVASIRTYVQEGHTVASQPPIARPRAVSPAKRPEGKVAKLPEVSAAPRRRRHAEPPARILLRCAQGCTFQRARRSPVRCPSDRSRTCAVSPV